MYVYSLKEGGRETKTESNSSLEAETIPQASLPVEVSVLSLRGLDNSESLFGRQFRPKPWSLQTGDKLVWRVIHNSIPKRHNTESTFKKTVIMGPGSLVWYSCLVPGAPVLVLLLASLPPHCLADLVHQLLPALHYL